MLQPAARGPGHLLHLWGKREPGAPALITFAKRTQDSTLWICVSLALKEAWRCWHFEKEGACLDPIFLT